MQTYKYIWDRTYGKAWFWLDHSYKQPLYALNDLHLCTKIFQSNFIGGLAKCNAFYSQLPDMLTICSLSSDDIWTAYTDTSVCTWKLAYSVSIRSKHAYLTFSIHFHVSLLTWIVSMTWKSISQIHMVGQPTIQYTALLPFHLHGETIVFHVIRHQRTCSG